MAKNSAGSEDRAKVKFRVIEFELEGGNAAVENSVRNLTHALAQRNGSPALPKLPGLRTPAPALQGTAGNGSSTEEEVVIEETTDEPDAIAEPASAPKGSRGPRRPPVPEVIDIDLTTGDVPFKEYCEGKNLSNDWRKYLACASWLKDYRSTTALTDDHIYTMFKFMKWPLPGDVAGPLRAMKKQGYFTTPERGKYAINHLGENEINQAGAS